MNEKVKNDETADKTADERVDEERAEKARLMGEGDIKKTLLHLSIPAIIAMLISAIYNLTDTAFVGMLHNNWCGIYSFSYFLGNFCIRTGAWGWICFIYFKMPWC